MGPGTLPKFYCSVDGNTDEDGKLIRYKIKPHFEGSSPGKRNRAESNGIFILRTGFIHSRLAFDAEEFQGFTIADPHAPFIFINSDEYDHWDALQVIPDEAANANSMF